MSVDKKSVAVLSSDLGAYWLCLARITRSCSIRTLHVTRWLILPKRRLVSSLRKRVNRCRRMINRLLLVTWRWLYTLAVPCDFNFPLYYPLRSGNIQMYLCVSFWGVALWRVHVPMHARRQLQEDAGGCDTIPKSSTNKLLHPTIAPDTQGSVTARAAIHSGQRQPCSKPLIAYTWSVWMQCTQRTTYMMTIHIILLLLQVLVCTPASYNALVRFVCHTRPHKFWLPSLLSFGLWSFAFGVSGDSHRKSNNYCPT